MPINILICISRFAINNVFNLPYKEVQAALPKEYNLLMLDIKHPLSLSVFQSQN